MANKNTPRSRAEQKAATQARRTARQEKAARAAENLKAQQKARKRQERMIVIGVVLVIALIVGLVAWALARNDSGKSATPPANVTDTYALSLGEADAEREVVIYEDFLCPACGVLEGLVADSLDGAIEDGTARVEWRVVEILGRQGDYSMRSANAFAVVLDTAGPEVAKEFHDTLYDEQPGEGSDYPDDDWLVEQAVAAGADEDEIRPGIEDLQFEGWVEAATDEFSENGYTGTPTVLLDGEKVAGETIQEVAANLQAGLGATS